MAQAKQCDRCGNLYIPYTTKILKFDANGVSLIRRLAHNINYENLITLDLCTQCIHSFNKWLTEEKEE